MARGVGIAAVVGFLLGAAGVAAAQEPAKTEKPPFNARYGGEVRLRYYFVENLYDKNDDRDDTLSFGTEMVRLSLDAEPAEKIELRLGAFQAHALGTGNWVVDRPPIRDHQERAVEVYRANLLFKGLLHQDVDACVGRQEILFGEGFLIGDGVRLEDLANLLGYIENNRTDFDAVKLDWRREGLKTQAFAARVSDTEADESDRELWMYGIDLEAGPFAHQTPGLSLVYARDERGLDDLRGDVVGAPFTSALTPFTLDDRNRRTFAAALRSKGAIAPQVLYKIEAVREWGKSPQGAADNILSGRVVDLDAWGGYAQVAYAFDADYKNLLRFKYVYLSGDDNGDDENGEFDPLLESQIIGLIFNAQSNVAAANVGGSIMSVADWQFHLNAWQFRYAEDYSLVLPYGLARDSSHDAGREVDLQVSHDFRKNIAAELVAGILFPGDVWKHANNNPLGYNTSDDNVWGIRLTISYTF